jgi:16S rRNA C1402 N4-methylase RsmH
MAELMTKKPLIPTPEELKANQRARSAKLRIIKKL